MVLEKFVVFLCVSVFVVCEPYSTTSLFFREKINKDMSVLLGCRSQHVFDGVGTK